MSHLDSMKIVGKLVKNKKEKRTILNIRLRSINRHVFYFLTHALKRKNGGYGNRLAFPKFQRFLVNICSFQKILLIKVFGCPWYESSKRYKNSSVGILPCETSCMLYQGLGRFFRGMIITRGFVSQNAGTVPEFSIFTFLSVLLVREFLVSTLI